MTNGPHDFGVTNPAPHVHTPIQTDQGPVCTTCRAVVIEPILDHNDPRLPDSVPKAKVLLFNAIADILKCGPQKLDFVLIGLADATNTPWPDYVEQVAQAYAGNPPHVLADFAAEHGVSFN